jgi:hypothetical protein
MDCPVVLPALLPGAEVAVHDVFADDGDGYTRHDEVSYGAAERARDLPGLCAELP